MENQIFKAMVVQETAEKKFNRKIANKSVSELPPGDVLIKVKYSSLNYKDALSASGNKGVTRNYPHTPGIDASGIVEESISADFKPGDKVIVTSYDLGMNTSGGFGQYIRTPVDWVVKLPSGLSLKESMIYGTAGFTAGLSVHKMIHTIKPEHGEILVTGASGGVGSMAVSILSKCGYEVVAVSGKTEEKGFLTDLGAKEIISREDATDVSGRPLLKRRWAGVIDTVGGDILATAIKSVKQGGTVTCCGNVASPDLPLTVFPFILRDVSLLGVDSQNCAMPLRLKIWNKLAADWKSDHLVELSSEIGLDDLDDHIELILKGKKKGRTIINLA
ncbi:YhdH/YhfP family quinone oxidoreductase [Desulfococcaceae bacterium HSG7]|nr:YhdH/YhfP family quinone oxidoreductase [Desulfococcaceae bacterium HSG9]MDM8556242.1 YhdH/YhfP family quinone oxidoreductase [Desulfococcaceae bacterium HSG7]